MTENVKITVKISDELGGELYDLLTNKKARKTGLVPDKSSFRACLETFAAEAIEGWLTLTRLAFACSQDQRQEDSSCEERV